ncbi:hypothetical protein EV368DRAFT_69715 [Lentinula lateritia]|nr:hypothetical protein EV368DRAFT_69715 [Lentinula lateritia]
MQSLTLKNMDGGPNEQGGVVLSGPKSQAQSISWPFREIQRQERLYLITLVAALAVCAAPHTLSKRDLGDYLNPYVKNLQTRGAGLFGAKNPEGEMIELQPLRTCKLEIRSLSYFDKKTVDTSFVEHLVLKAAQERNLFEGAHVEFVPEWKYSSEQCPSEPIVLNVNPVDVKQGVKCASDLSVELGRANPRNHYVVYALDGSTHKNVKILSEGNQRRCVKAKQNKKMSRERTKSALRKAEYEIRVKKKWKPAMAGSTMLSRRRV